MRFAAECVVLVLWLRLLVFGVLGVVAVHRRGPRGAPPPGRVAVIVPAFDEADGIAATLASLRGQTRPADEIVVVDDGSRDDTAAIARSALAGVAGATVLRLPANRGKAAALNAGLAASRAGFVVTLDADTRLAPDALEAALAALADADAAAFVVDVAPADRFVQRLQRQEYAAALDVERRAQAQLGVVSVLPGAATLFRRAALPTPAFSGRTRTEDADLTLALGRRGERIVVADRARAFTVAPDRWRALFVQRVRWTAGHLQCVWHHGWPATATLRFRCLTAPNFVLATLTPPLGLAALATLALAEAPGAIGAGRAVVISLLLVYAQRALAPRRAGWAAFVAEPLVSGAAGCALCIAALLSLARRRRSTRA